MAVLLSEYVRTAALLIIGKQDSYVRGPSLYFDRRRICLVERYDCSLACHKQYCDVHPRSYSVDDD
jgi:hypothetical protein